MTLGISLTSGLVVGFIMDLFPGVASNVRSEAKFLLSKPLPLLRVSHFLTSLFLFRVVQEFYEDDTFWEVHPDYVKTIQEDLALASSPNSGQTPIASPKDANGAGQASSQARNEDAVANSSGDFSRV